MSIKAVTGKLPVNIVFVAEGDEERMDIGVRKFVKDHPDFFKNVDALIGEAGTQSPSGGGGVGGGSEGCVYFELTTSGKSWGRGPVQSDIHGSNKRAVDSPAWRHMKMLASLVSDDGNTPLVKGFLDGLEPMSADETNQLKTGGSQGGHESGGREHRRRPLHLRRSVHDAEDGALRHVVQPRRHLGRQHVRRRRRRDPAEQDHLEAQHPLLAEDERPRDREARSASSSIATATRTSS